MTVQQEREKLKIAAERAAGAAASLARDGIDVAEYGARLAAQERLEKLDRAVQVKVAREGVVRHEYGGTWITPSGANIEHGRAYFADGTSCSYTWGGDGRLPHSYSWSDDCGIPY